MSQTQPELAKYINVSYCVIFLIYSSFISSCLQDVFGASDDEDDDVIVPSRRPSVSPGDAVARGGGLATSGFGEPNLFESDEEDEANQRAPPSKKLKLGSKDPTAAKSRASAKIEPKRKSQPAMRPVPSLATAEAPQWADSEEDEYASDREPERTAEDDEFIDRDDENTDLVREYDEDKQDFNDHRPSGSKASARARTIGPEDASNPLTQTLVDMKRKRYDEWSDEKKSQIAHELLVQMDRAVVEDEELFRVGNAAIVKVKALPRVQALVGIKGLQSTLLDHDLLSALRKWIEPRDKNTLPALAVRAAVYDMLRKLPCQLDHLRRSGIGKTIMALLKHNLEIDANKQLLNEIVEKWNRLIFNKSSDARSRTQRMASASASGAVTISAAPTQPSGSSGARSGATSSEQRGLDEILAGKNSHKIDDEFNRVRVPFSSGFMFSVRPESTVDKKSVLEAMREASGGTKDVISKRMKDMAGSSKKQAFRPVGVSVTGKAPK
jgi:transcription factor SPN1